MSRNAPRRGHARCRYRRRLQQSGVREVAAVRSRAGAEPWLVHKARSAASRGGVGSLVASKVPQVAGQQRGELAAAAAQCNNAREAGSSATPG